MSFLPKDYQSPDDISNYAGIKTHSNYVTNLYLLIKDNNLSINLEGIGYNLLKEEQKINRKLEIVKYTLNSIKTEYNFALQDSDFMPLTLSWLWVKGYYTIFHLTSLLVAFEKHDSRYLLDRKYNHHSKIITLLGDLLKTNLFFSIRELNNLYSGTELARFRGNFENVRSIENFDEKLFKLSLKKVYKDEVKIHCKGKRGRNRKKETDKFNSKMYGIFDLFQYYRERFNYAGFQYLESDGNPNSILELTKFYKSSFEVIISISESLLKFLIAKSDNIIKQKLSEI